MNEYISTQKSVDKSPEHSSEEIKLRDLIHSLEEQSRYVHGDKADTLESKILANEDELRIEEKTIYDKIPTLNTMYTVKEPYVNEVAEPSVTDTSRELLLNKASETTNTDAVVEHTLSKIQTPVTELVKIPVEKDTLSTQETTSDNKAQHLAERAQVEEARTKMVAAEAAYLGVRQQNKDQGNLTHLAGKNSPEKIQRDRTQELREVYDKTRSDFSNAVNLSVQKRFTEKHITESNPNVELRTEKVYKEKVLNRYNRMAVSSDVIKHSLKEKEQEKQEGLDGSGRVSLEKALGWYARKNKSLEKKRGKSIARSIRILTFAAIGSVAGGFFTAEHDASVYTERLPTSTNAVRAAARNISSIPKRVSAQIPKEIISAGEKKGTGADALFGHLKESLRTEYPDINTAPPEVQHILDTQLHKLSTEYGFAKTGESGLMHTNDTLSYNPSNGDLVFADAQGAHILESTSNGELIKGATFDKFNGHYTQDTTQGSISTEQDVMPEVTTQTTSEVGKSSVDEHTDNTVNGLTHHDGVLRVAPDADVSHNSSVKIVNSSDNSSVHSGIYEGTNTPQNISHSVDTAISSATESIATPNNEIAELLQNNALGHYVHTSVSDVLYKSPEISQQLHNHLVETVANSGVGPVDNETLEHFLTRANKVITERGTPTYKVGVNGLSVPVDQTQIYTDTDGRLVVYGGDSPAQHLVAYQYLNKHPDARILFERSAHDSASGINTLTLHASPIPSANSQSFQSFTPLRDSSGKIIQSIDPSTLVGVVH